MKNSLASKNGIRPKLIGKTPMNSLGFHRYFQMIIDIFFQKLMYFGMTPAEIEKTFGNHGKEGISEEFIVNRIHLKQIEMESSGMNPEGFVTEPIGSGYGFFLQRRYPVIPYLYLGNYKKLTYDSKTDTVTAAAGNTLGEICQFLQPYQRALPTSGDFSQVSLGGALHTFVHGSSAEFDSMVDVVRSIRMVNKKNGKIQTLSDKKTIKSEILTNQNIILEANLDTVKDFVAERQFHVFENIPIDKAQSIISDFYNTQNSFEIFVYFDEEGKLSDLCYYITLDKPTHKMLSKNLNEPYFKSLFMPGLGPWRKKIKKTVTCKFSDVGMQWRKYSKMTRFFQIMTGNTQIDSEFAILGPKSSRIAVINDFITHKIKENNLLILRNGKNVSWVEIIAQRASNHQLARYNHVSIIRKLIEICKANGVKCIPHRGKWAGTRYTSTGNPGPLFDPWDC